MFTQEEFVIVNLLNLVCDGIKSEETLPWYS